MSFNSFLLISFYFFVFILPGIGIIFGIIELKNKISNKNAVSKKKNNRFGIYGIVSILFIIFLLFFPIHTVLSLKYSKPESLLNYFEKNFDYFEKYSFGYMPYTAGISWCRLGKERTPNEKYDGYMKIELEYRVGTLFNIYPDKKFNNIIVYSENDIITNNPRPELFKKIEPTSHENWYFVYVTDAYIYF